MGALTKNRKRVLLVLAVLPILIFALWRITGQGESGILPPEFVLYVKQPEPAFVNSPHFGSWVSPASITSVGGRLFVLDTGNNRILQLDKTGKVISTICEEGDCQFLLNKPQAITALGDLLYVANTDAGQVVVLSCDGSVVRTTKIVIPGAAETEMFSPSGIAVSPAGEVYVSDPAMNLVLRLTNDDQMPFIFLDERGKSEEYRVNKPMGLALDASGNLYVANSGNGRIRKYSPGGRHLQEFAMQSNPTFFSPAQLAVDAGGNVYFTDNQKRLVYVYSEAGTLVGVVGVLDARRADSPGVLRDPWGLYMQGNSLYVIDRTAGLFDFQIDPAYWKTPKSSQVWGHY